MVTPNRMLRWDSGFNLFSHLRDERNTTIKIFEAGQELFSPVHTDQNRYEVTCCAPITLKFDDTKVNFAELEFTRFQFYAHKDEYCKYHYFPEVSVQGAALTQLTGLSFDTVCTEVIDGSVDINIHKPWRCACLVKLYIKTDNFRANGLSFRVARAAT